MGGGSTRFRTSYFWPELHGVIFITRTGSLKAFIMFPLNHQQLLKTSARNDSARFLEAFPVSIPSPTFIRIKNFFRCSSANIHGTNIKGGISGPYKRLDGFCHEKFKELCNVKHLNVTFRIIIICLTNAI